MELEYNTSRTALPITEYGRIITKLINAAIAEDDRQKRNLMAQEIVKAMSRLNPQNKDAADYWQKIWDHLFILSDFKLDVDSPFPKPTENLTKLAPVKIDYPSKSTHYRFYGKNIQSIIRKTTQLEDNPEKNQFIRQLANHLKKAYLTWNRDSVNDEIIVSHLSDLSENQIKLDETTQLERTSDILAQNKKGKFNERSEKFQKHKKNNFRKQ